MATPYAVQGLGDVSMELELWKLLQFMDITTDVEKWKDLRN